MSVALCPDAQSPDIDAVCPPDPVLHINYPRELPATGLEVNELLLWALILILAGLFIFSCIRHGRTK